MTPAVPGRRLAGRFWRLLRPTPFKAGLGAILLCSFVYLSFGPAKPALLAALDNQLTSAMFRWRGPRPADPRIVIVDIDESSLQRIGQWPWPRDKVAALVDALRRQGARVIGLDMQFVEPDRTAPRWLLQNRPAGIGDPTLAAALRRWAEAPQSDYDALLGQALARAPSVLGYTMILQHDNLKDPAQRPFPSAGLRLQPPSLRFDQLGLRRAWRSTAPLPAVAQAESEGFLNVFPAESGSVLKVPLLMSLDGIPYPSLTLEMARIGLGETSLTLHGTPQGSRGRQGLLGVSIGARFIPTDDRGELAINYRGPYRSYRYLSAADLLAGETFAVLKGAFVLVGSSASGLLDLQTTPFFRTMPGVEIHAAVLDNLLHGDPLAQDEFSEIGLTFSLILVGGLLVTLLLTFGRPLPGAVAAMLLVALTVAGCYRYLFLRGTVVGLTYPLASILVVCLVVILANQLLADREKRFLQGAFRHYLAPQVVGELLQHPEQLALSGQEKHLSVLFSDIRDFTTLAEQLDTARLGGFLNRYLTEVSRVITREQGMVDKFIGDAVMAIWGAPVDNPRHPLQAVRAALAMQRRIAELAGEWQTLGLPEIRIGIGVNTGLMRVGNFGSDELFDYTVVGDQVNLASRIEGLNKVYGTSILISAATREALGEQVLCRRIDLVRVKGKTAQVEIFEPLGFGREPDPATRQWEQALACYRQRHFAEARRLLEALEVNDPRPLYRLYLERVAQFERQPPPDDWDGCFIHLRK